jgi:hypothetical protein
MEFKARQREALHFAQQIEQMKNKGTQETLYQVLFILPNCWVEQILSREKY